MAYTSSPEKSSAPGRDADTPAEIPKRGWWAIAKRVRKEVEDDHIAIVGAGVAFYFFLAIFPALTAFISIYGLVVTPTAAAEQIEEVAGALPYEGKRVISDIVIGLTNQSSDKLGWGLFASIVISLWSAKKGTNALFDGINIAYDEKETRGFIKKNIITLLVTIAMVIGGVIAIGLVALVPATIDLLPLPDFLASIINFLRWPIVAVMIVFFLAWLYRIAPDRSSAEWKWISPGSVLATILWLAGSAGFSWYIDTFGSMDKTYGTFAAVVILMLWLSLTAFVVLLGAELNSEMELQTAVDTTTGPSEPMGERRAFGADHVVLATDDLDSTSSNEDEVPSLDSE